MALGKGNAAAELGGGDADVADFALVVHAAGDGVAVQRHFDGFEEIERAAAPEELRVEDLLEVLGGVRRRHAV